MIIRDLYRSSIEELRHALAASNQTARCRGVVVPVSAVEADDVERLAAWPTFDPSLSFVGFEAGEPVAFLVSRIQGNDAIWSLLGGADGAEQSFGTLLEEAMDHWRQAGARRARLDETALLAAEPRLDEGAGIVALLKERDYEVTQTSADMDLELRTLAPSQELTEREAELRRKGYVVRPARPDEAALVGRQFHPRRAGHTTLEFWNLFIRQLVPETLLVAEFRRQLVGFAAPLGWTVGGECPCLGPHFVEKVHRDTGLADILLTEFAKAAKAAGRERIRIHCMANDAARYERLGFAATTRYCHEAVGDLT